MKIQSNVTLWGIYSVWLRHAKVYQKTWVINFVAPITEPIINLVALGFGLMPLVGKVMYEGQAYSYFDFLAPGMIATGMMSHAFTESAFSGFIRLSYQKTWHALLTAPLSFTEVFLGELLWGATRGFIAGLFTAVLEVIFGLYPSNALLLSIPIICLGSFLFSAMGLLTAGVVRTLDHINLPMYLLIIPMYVICGTYFPRTTLPSALGTVADFLPLSPLVDLLRWPLGLPDHWWIGLLWTLVSTAVLIVLAWRRIYPQLFR